MPIATTSLTAPITAVTVFPDRARVTRAVRAALTPGLQRLVLEDLPLATMPDSVRAGGRGTARAKLLGVSTRREQFQETPAAAVAELQNKIRAVEDHDTELAAEASFNEKALGHLDALAGASEMYARGLALRNRTTEEQGAIFDFLDARAWGHLSRIQAIGRQRYDLAKELDLLRRQLSDLGAAKPKQRYSAAVELDVSAAGDFELELTYVVGGAGWQPLYDVRLIGDALDLTYLAQVQQNTGEDWPSVALTLSTARPSLSLAIPELEPWYVRPRPPMTPMPQAVRSAAPMPSPAGKAHGRHAGRARATGGGNGVRCGRRVGVGRIFDLQAAWPGRGAGQRRTAQGDGGRAAAGGRI